MSARTAAIYAGKEPTPLLRALHRLIAYLVHLDHIATSRQLKLARLVLVEESPT